jgi:hypothetical protein
MRGALLLLFLCCSGCYVSTFHYGTPIATDLLPDVQDGKTTRAEVFDKFGPPAAFYRPELIDLIFENEDLQPIPGRVDDDIYTYQYVTTQVKIFFLPILFLHFNTESVSDTLVVFFDEKGVVRYHAFRHDDPNAASDD